MKHLLTLFAMLLLAANATSYPNWSAETLYTKAQFVAVGTVGPHETTETHTVTPLSNVTMFVGSEDDLHLRWELGPAGLPVPNPGATVLVFAYDAPGGVSPIVGFASGIFTQDRGSFRNPAGKWLGLTQAGQLFLGTRADAAASEDVLAALQNPTFETPEPLTEPKAEQASEQASKPAPDSDSEPAGNEAPRTFALSVSAELASHSEFIAALAAWNEALAPHTIEVTTPEQANMIVGNPRRLGDALSLSVQQEGAVISEISTTASAPEVFNAALLEIALQLGATPGSSGVLAPSVPLTKQAISAADVAAVLRATPAIVGDINADGVVDFHDLLLLAAKFGETGLNLPEDLNNDGVVDNADIAILQEHYTFTAPKSR